jgi:hypothetical protein
MSFPDISVVDIFDAYSTTPSPDTLLAYDCVILANNNPFDNPTAMGNVLADYVDAGGGLVLTAPSFVSGYAVEGRLLDEGYMPFDIGSGPIGPLNLGNFNASHPVMKEVSSALGDALANTNIAPEAELIAEWNTDSTGRIPFIAIKDFVAGANIYFGNSGFWTGDIPIILHNVILSSIMRAVPWMHCNPTSGTIAPDDMEFIVITFDATGLESDDYYANMIITSNDPERPVVYVPSHLHVSGVPDIVISADSLDQGIVYPGFCSVDTLTVSNEGTDLLTVSNISSDNSDFTIDTTNFTLNPGETQDIVITFTPSSMGLITGNLLIESNDPDEAALTVFLKGECVEPPVISVQPGSLSDTLTSDQSSKKIIRIYNAGASDLIFNIATGEMLSGEINKSIAGKISLSSQSIEYLEVRKYEEDPRKGNPVVLGAGGPDSSGYNWIDSDEGSDCQFDWIDITSTGTQVTGLSDDNFVGPYPISFEFPFYDSVYTEFYIASNGFIGFGPTSGYSNFSNQPIPTSNTPNNIIAWCWDDLNQNGSVYYQDFGDRLVVQFVDYGEYGASGRINAEVTIYRSGKIIIQYLNSHDGFDLLSNTIGIENTSGNDGLQVAFNTDYIHDSLAVEFSIGPSWLSINPLTDTVSSGDSVMLAVNFDAAGLEVGDYYSDIIINNNDPLEPKLIVPAHLYVVGSGVEEKGIPKKFFISQNTPNPFNRQTVIKYGCPRRSHVCIQLFDVMGRVANTLIDKEVEAGYHEIKWDGNNKLGRKLPNAVYFYRMRVDKENFMEIKKMILLQ